MEFDKITWQLKTPDRATEKSLWIDNLSKLRGEALYENGQRPAFRLANGDFFDRDNLETISYHILAHLDDKLLGAVRLTPLKTPYYHCIASQIVGESQFMIIIDTLFKNESSIMELNRVVVHKDYRNFNLGVYLIAASFIIAEKLNYFPIANGNIHLLTSFHLKHLGGILFDKFAGPYTSKRYNDNEIYLIYFNKNGKSPYFLRQMITMKFIESLL